MLSKDSCVACLKQAIRSASTTLNDHTIGTTPHNLDPLTRSLGSIHPSVTRLRATTSPSYPLALLKALEAMHMTADVSLTDSDVAEKERLQRYFCTYRSSLKQSEADPKDSSDTPAAAPTTTSDQAPNMQHARQLTGRAVRRIIKQGTADPLPVGTVQSTKDLEALLDRLLRTYSYNPPSSVCLT